MGELADLPDWLIATIVVVGGLAVTFGFAWRNTKRQIASTLARRPNPTREEFLAQMGLEVSPAAAEFLWDTALTYLEPKLTPHPDDDLAKHLPIDDGDWSMDWPREFAVQQGFDESNLPDWPTDWPATLRNYGRWLSLGPAG